MGTSGSFGGSTTQSWQAVAAAIEASGDETGGDTETDGSSTDPSVNPVEQIAEAIATALQNDDPAIKPRRAPRSTPGDSGLSYGALTGNTRRVGTTAPPPSGGRRQIATSVGRAGRAVGAGYAFARGDAVALGEYGLELATLSDLDKFSQIHKILEAVDIQDSGPDDIALRATVVELLDRIIDGTETPEPIDTLVEMVASYTNHLLSVELDALVQHGSLDPALVNSHRDELADYIAIRAAELRGHDADLAKPSQFEHAARELLRATLGLLTGDGKI